MNDAEMSQYIQKLEGVDVVVNEFGSFFFYNPDPNVPPDHRFPFATLLTNDLNDQFSDLNRPSVFRLNIGIGKESFRSRFGVFKPPSGKDSAPESENEDSSYDFKALDQLMPHPVYGQMYWVCVLNPSDETFETQVRPLLMEAYETAVSKYDKQAARRK